MTITKKQEEIIKKKIAENENKTIYTCKECKKKIKGLIKVREHRSEFNHYNFRTKGGYTLGFL